EPFSSSDDSAVVSSEGQCVSEQYPHNDGYAHDKYTLHHCISNIFSPYKAPIKECKPRRHEKHKRCTEQNKSSISCVHNLFLHSFFSFDAAAAASLSREKKEVQSTFLHML